MEIYERSRQRKHSHNVSASSSMAWARRGLGDGGMARTQGAPNQRKRDKLRIADFVPDCIRLAVLQATKRQTIGNQINAAMIVARSTMVRPVRAARTQETK